MKSIPQRIDDGELCVMLSEEYGYRYWFWFPGMTIGQLKMYWISLKPSEAYNDITKHLAGELIEATEDLLELFEQLDTASNLQAHLHWDDDSWLVVPGEKVVYNAKGYYYNLERVIRKP
jgi:hypothetical protein